MDVTTMKFSVLTEKGHAEVRERRLPAMGPENLGLRIIMFVRPEPW